MGQGNDKSRHKFSLSPSHAAMIRALFHTNVFIPRQRQIQVKVRIHTMERQAGIKALLVLHPRSYLGACALLYFYSASMCTTGPLTAPTGLTSAVATISILSSYVLIRFTLPDLPNSSHCLTHVQPLPPDSFRLPLHRYVHA